MKPHHSVRVLILVASLTGGVPLAAFAGQGQTQAASAPQAAPLPAHLTDRGTGLPTSMFGTYIRRGELVVYPFYEYYGDRNFEYKPSEFGVPGDVDFRGRYRANEGILLVAYGLRDNLAFEMEAAVISASFDKSPADASALPARLTESGLGDVEAQLRWRWRKETEARPELFSYTEVVFPHAKAKDLIGTPGWEVKVGTGVIRGFRWGTLTVRGAVEFSQASSSHVDVGEYAVEYLKRISPRFRVFLGLEGTQDELSAIAEAQWHVRPGTIVKFNLGRGVTSKATDWAPEVGILFTWPGR